jgi:uncharacterized membrane protein YqjE
MAANGEVAITEQQARDWRTQPTNDRSLGELLSEITTDLSTLLRKEIQLARVETMEKASRATQSIVLMVAGGLLAYTGVIALVIGVIVGLANWMPLWVSALVVGLVLAIIGAVLIQSGRASLKNMSLAPEKTIESIKEDAEMVKEKVS